jgi:hypothetical protein
MRHRIYECSWNLPFVLGQPLSKNPHWRFVPMKGVLSGSITGSSYKGGNFSDGAEAPQRLLGHRMVVATSAYLGMGSTNLFLDTSLSVL